MSDKKFTIAAEIIARSASFKAGMRDAQSSLNTWTKNARSSVNSLKGAFSSLGGKLASIGLGFSAFEIIKGSAQLDKQLNRLGISAGKPKEEIKGLREQIEKIGIKTGQNVGELANGFEKVFQLTGSWDIARKAIDSVGTAVAVTGANTDLLAESLAVAQTSFGIDLTKNGAASGILNKLAGIGTGAGGLSNVAGIFNEIAPLANLSGMNFDETTKLISTIAQVTKNPAQMSEYAQQTLRLFTNLRAITSKKSSLGKLIFDESGNRKSPLETMQSINNLYSKLNDKNRTSLMQQLVGADPRAMRSVQMILNSKALLNPQPVKSINLEERLPQVLDNAIDQANRLKNTLEEAGEKFAAPINKALANMVHYAIDVKGLKGLDIAGLGLSAAGIAWLGSRVLKGGLGKFLGGKAGVAEGVAEGSLLKQIGVMPVYVVNFSEMSGAGGLSGGSFQEYLPAGPALKKSMMLLPWLGLAGAGIAAGAGGVYLGSKLEKKQEAAGIPENERYSSIVASRFSGGYIYHPKHALTNENTPNSTRSDHSTFAGPLSPKMETQVNVYIDGEKKPPSKIVTSSRGNLNPLK